MTGRYDTDPLGSPFYNVAPLDRGRARRLPARRRQRRVGVAARPRDLGSGDRRRGTDLHVPAASRPRILDRRPGPGRRFPACSRTQLPGERIRRLLGPLPLRLHRRRRGVHDRGRNAGRRLRPVRGHRDRRCHRHDHVPPRGSRTRTSSTSSPIPPRIRCPKASRCTHCSTDDAFPGTGPYTFTGRTENEVRLGRNPRFRVWDAAVRPDGFPDEIVFTFVQGDGQPRRDGREERSRLHPSVRRIARAPGTHPDTAPGPDPRRRIDARSSSN